jgi:hypothetical protein
MGEPVASQFLFALARRIAKIAYRVEACTAFQQIQSMIFKEPCRNQRWQTSFGYQ